MPSCAAGSAEMGTFDPAKRLDHLHDIVQRLAGNSFTVKGWAVTVASGFLGFAAKDANPKIAFVGLIPITIFWVIDAYYLAQERHFRARYNALLTDGAQEPVPVVGQVLQGSALLRAMGTFVVAVLYLALIAACLLLGVGLFVRQA